MSVTQFNIFKYIFALAFTSAQMAAVFVFKKHPFRDLLEKGQIFTHTLKKRWGHFPQKL